MISRKTQARGEGRVNYEIADRPPDYPEHVVVRRQTPGTTPLRGVGVTRHESIEEARASLPHGLTNIGRDPHDDPFVIENWV